LCFFFLLFLSPNLNSQKDISKCHSSSLHGITVSLPFTFPALLRTRAQLKGEEMEREMEMEGLEWSGELERDEP
jgi:hypothetical protein